MYVEKDKTMAKNEDGYEKYLGYIEMTRSRFAKTF